MKRGCTADALISALNESKKKTPPPSERELWVAFDGDQDLWIGFVKVNGRFTYLESMDSINHFTNTLFYDSDYVSVTVVKGDVSKRSGMQRAYLAAQHARISY